MGREKQRIQREIAQELAEMELDRWQRQWEEDALDMEACDDMAYCGGCGRSFERCICFGVLINDHAMTGCDDFPDPSWFYPLYQPENEQNVL